MFLDIRQNSIANSTNNFGTDSYFTICKDIYEGTVFWACFSSVNVLFGIPACVAVLWELLQRHRRGVPMTPNDVFMLNLTVMDLVFLSFCPLGICNYVFLYSRLIDKIYNAIIVFSTIGRPLFTTCICLDCYLAVVHPFTYMTKKGLTPRVLVSIGVWVITLVYAGLYAAFFEILITHAVSVFPYVLTILTIGICDFFILRALKRSDPGGRDLHPQKKKALQIIINSLVMTVIAYLPPLLVFCLERFSSMNFAEFLCKVSIIAPLSTTVGSTVMPVLYLYNLGKLDGVLPCRSA